MAGVAGEVAIGALPDPRRPADVVADRTLEQLLRLADQLQRTVDLLEHVTTEVP